MWRLVTKVLLSLGLDEVMGEKEEEGCPNCRPRIKVDKQFRDIMVY